MNSKAMLKAKEWFKKAEHDLATVEMIINTSGYPDVAGVLLQQALEKYLKGYLISQGWKLAKIHNLEDLLDEAVKHNKKYEKFYDLVPLSPVTILKRNILLAKVRSLWKKSRIRCQRLKN